MLALIDNTPVYSFSERGVYIRSESIRSTRITAQLFTLDYRLRLHHVNIGRMSFCMTETDSLCAGVSKSITAGPIWD